MPCSNEFLGLSKIKFSLKTLLLIVLLASITFAWLGSRWRLAVRQQEAVAAAEEIGGKVLYDYQHRIHAGDMTPTSLSDPDKRKAGSLSQVLGKDLTNDATFLYFTDSAFTGEGLELLPRFPELEILQLSGTSVSDAALKNFEGMNQLKALHLSFCKGISDEGLKSLATLSDLRTINLEQTNIGDPGLEHISTLKQLIALGLDGTRITDDGLKSLHNMDRLRTLNLGRVRLSDNGLILIKPLVQLEELRIGGTDVSNKGLQHLAVLSSLRLLDIGDTKITDDGIQYLEKLSKLETLGLFNTQISHEGIRRLKKAFPTITIHR